MTNPTRNWSNKPFPDLCKTRGAHSTHSNWNVPERKQVDSVQIPSPVQKSKSPSPEQVALGMLYLLQEFLSKKTVQGKKIMNVSQLLSGVEQFLEVHQKDLSSETTKKITESARQIQQQNIPLTLDSNRTFRPITPEEVEREIFSSPESPSPIPTPAPRTHSIGLSPIPLRSPTPTVTEDSSIETSPKETRAPSPVINELSPPELLPPPSTPGEERSSPYPWMSAPVFEPDLTPKIETLVQSKPTDSKSELRIDSMIVYAGISLVGKSLLHQAAPQWFGYNPEQTLTWVARAALLSGSLSLAKHFVTQGILGFSVKSATLGALGALASAAKLIAPYTLPIQPQTPCLLEKLPLKKILQIPSVCFQGNEMGPCVVGYQAGGYENPAPLVMEQYEKLDYLVPPEIGGVLRAVDEYLTPKAALISAAAIGGMLLLKNLWKIAKKGYTQSS